MTPADLLAHIRDYGARSQAMEAQVNALIDLASPGGALMRAWLQHWCSDLHLFCRLRDCGLSTGTAKRWAATLTGWLRPLLYRREKKEGGHAGRG